MFVTLDVSKELRSREGRDLQYSNMSAMIVTLDVSSLERSIVVQFFMLENHSNVVLGLTASTNLTDLTDDAAERQSGT